MDILELREYCLSKPHTDEGFPFGETTLVFKVAGKLFALVNIDNQDPSVNLKCEPERAVELREHYPEIKPGYHMSKKHWNTVDMCGSLRNDFLKELIDHSYEQVVKSLPKKLRTELFK